MKILTRLNNSTSNTIYDGFDSSHVICSVGSFDELDDVLPELLAEKVFINETSFEYRLYDGTGTNFQYSRIFVQQNGALNAQSLPITNVVAGTNDTDGVNKKQVSNLIKYDFREAVHAKQTATDVMVDLRDLTRSNGYGLNNDLITYQGIGSTGQAQPTAGAGKIFFLHNAINSRVGWIMIHQDLLSGYVDGNTQAIPFLAGSVMGALGKYNQSAKDLVGSDAIWNCQGVAISNTHDANDLPQFGYLSADDERVQTLEDAASAVYTYGPFDPVDEYYLFRGNVFNKGDQNSEFRPDFNSEYFCTKCTIGGTTFPTKKLFQVFFKSYENEMFSTTSSAQQLGLQMEGNTERIESLEKEVFSGASTVLESLIESNTNRLVNAVHSANLHPGQSAYVF